ncbi:hypothetical protein [Sinomonas atrocyanea]
MNGHLVYIHHPGELPYRTADLEAMAADLRAKGHHLAASETEELLALTLAYMESVRARTDRLRSVWAAAEAQDGPELRDAVHAHARLDPLAPTAPKAAAWQTVIPGRRPEKKAHTTLGHAKSAVRGRIYRTADADMEILELDPITGTFKTLYLIPKGTPRDQMPWS